MDYPLQRRCGKSTIRDKPSNYEVGGNRKT